MTEPRWEVKIGSPVTVTDGDYGHLRQLLVDPQQQRVVGLLVGPHGWTASHTVVVPEGAIADASENEVRLKISREEMEDMPEYLPDFGLVSDGRNDSLLVQAGQKVFCRDEYAGRVWLILIEPGGQVKGFVLHTGHVLGRNLIVPIAWIQEVERDHVYLSVEKNDLESLPDYGLDDGLAAEVKAALWTDEILRNTDYEEIGVSVVDGTVRLQGHVTTFSNKTRAAQAACAVTGVLGLENELVLDENLVTQVAQALGKEERTRSEQISVGAENGFIKLNGQVGTRDTREAAEAIAAEVSQVRGVINYLQAPHVVINPKDLRILQPLSGQEVYATDMQLGRVESVIIDPRNRRVTAFVARGCIPDPRHLNDYRLPEEDPQPERSIVIPIAAVRYETDSSVLLEISGVQAAQYRAFDPADYMAPPSVWQPPYPYLREQVFFEWKKLEEPIGENSPMRQVAYAW